MQVDGRAIEADAPAEDCEDEGSGDHAPSIEARSVHARSVHDGRPALDPLCGGIWTIDDPGAYLRPWKVRRRLDLAPDEEILEYICNENHKVEHFVN